jgi:hypothetical protein
LDSLGSELPNDINLIYRINWENKNLFSQDSRVSNFQSFWQISFGKPDQILTFLISNESSNPKLFGDI